MLNRPLRILSILRPVADLSPRPRVPGGTLRELVWQIDPADLAGLEQAAGLKKTNCASVTLDALLIGRQEHEVLLRRAAGAGCDNLLRLDADPTAGFEELAGTIQELEAANGYGLILLGERCRSGDLGLGSALAGSMRRSHVVNGSIDIASDEAGIAAMVPAVVSFTGKSSAFSVSVDEAVHASFVSVRVFPPSVRSTAADYHYALPAGKEQATAAVSRPREAAEYLRAFARSISAVSAPAFQEEPEQGALAKESAVWAVLDPDKGKANLNVLRSARLASSMLSRKAFAIIAAPRASWPGLLGLAQAKGMEQAFCLDTRDGRLSQQGEQELVRSILKSAAPAVLVANEDWTHPLASVAGEASAANQQVLLAAGVSGMEQGPSGGLMLSSPAYDGKLVRSRAFSSGSAFITIASDADLPAAAQRTGFKAWKLDAVIPPEHLAPLSPATAPTLSQADVIIDLGYGIRDKAGLALAQELKGKLEALGLTPFFGATRKVTQDLKLLPLDAQIGQTGVRVNPRLVLALGISGAPQHIDYLGTRAEILCFNKDTDAPLMKLNKTRPAPRVHPLAGDLFDTVRELIDRLG